MLGVDFGAQRIGVAVSEGSVAVPLTIVQHENREQDLERVAAIARERAVAAVVVGLPVLESGEEGEQARRTRRFGDALARRLDVPVVYQDERYSSARAEAAMADGSAEDGRWKMDDGRKRSMRGRTLPGRTAQRGGKRGIDDVAAAVILQAYIDAAQAGAR